MQKRWSLVVVLLVASFLLPTSASAEGPNPAELYIQSVTYGGAGCPQGSVSQSFSADRETFTLLFDQFVASSGPGVPPAESQKNCQLNVNLREPPGIQVGVTAFDYRGFVHLPAGMTAESSTTYFFQGQQLQGTTTTFHGPVSQDYLATDSGLNVTTVWSACGTSTPLNINHQVRVIGPSDLLGQITTASIDGSVDTLVALSSRKC